MTFQVTFEKPACAEQLAVADGGIVGSYFKFNGNAHNRMDADRVRRFILASREAK